MADPGTTPSRRRNLPPSEFQSEKVLSPAQTTHLPGPSDTTPAVPASVLFKLLAFTLAMVVVPLGSYFVTLKLIFRGNSTFAGAFAAFMANVVLIAYVIVAWKEDQGDQEELRAAEKQRGGGGRGVVEGKKGQ